MLWFTILAVAAAVVAYFIWDHRNKAAIRDATSRRRFEDMFPVQAAARSGPATPAAPAAAPAATAPADATAAPVVLPPKGRFLGQPETLLYYLLKTGLPDHEVFANVSLAAVVGVAASGHDREQQLRRLAPYQLDFAVCDKSMHIVAAIEVESAAAADPAVPHVKAEILKQAGIRFVRINPAASPRRDQVRELVIGVQPPSGG